MRPRFESISDLTRLNESSILIAMARHRPGKIYALTPNPALDLSGHVSRIIPNEKNYVYRPRIDPGGNSINAARIAHRLGADPILLGFLGGAAGDQLRSLLIDERLKPRFISIRGLTRTNVTVTNDHNHAQTRLTFPGPVIRKNEVRALLSQIKTLRAPGILLLGGSAPSSLTSRFYADVIRSAQARNIGIMADTPARDLKGILAAIRSTKLLLIKPNETELEQLVSKKLNSDAARSEAARKLLKKAVIVCVSLGARGAIVAYRNESWLVKPPQVRARGTVGAGDSMVGAMAAFFAERGLVTPERLEAAGDEVLLKAARLGVAAGAATAMTEGTAQGSAPLIRKLFLQSRARRI